MEKLKRTLWEIFNWSQDGKIVVLQANRQESCSHHDWRTRLRLIMGCLCVCVKLGQHVFSNEVTCVVYILSVLCVLYVYMLYTWRVLRVCGISKECIVFSFKKYSKPTIIYVKVCVFCVLSSSEVSSVTLMYIQPSSYCKIIVCYMW